MPQDKVKEVYDLVSDLGYFEDENDFRSYVLDPNKRKEAYALISDAGYFEDENDFNSYFSDVKKKEQTQPFGGQIFTQGIGLGVKPISSTTSPSVSKQPKSIIPSEFTVEKPVSTAVGNIDLAAKAEDVSQRAEYLGKVSEGVLDIINKNPDIYISQKDIPTMYGEKVIPAGTPKVENISKAVDLYAEKIKKETGKDLLDADKQFLVQSVLSSLKNKKLNVEASSMTDLQLQGKKKLPLTAITGIKDEKGAVVKEGMFEENIKNIVSEEQMRLEKLSKTPSKEVSAEFSPEIEQLKSEVKNNSAALNAEMQSAFASKFDEVQKNVFLKYDGLVKSGQISADEANAQMKKELENIGAQLESDTNILYAPKFEQLKKDVDAKSQEIQTRYNRRVKAQFDLEKVKANKRIQDEVSRYKDALPKEYLEEYQALYQKNFESAMKMDGIKRINEFANLGNFEKMQTALMAGWGDVAGTVGGALSYVGLNTGGLQDWVAQSGIYNELPVFSEENILDNITSTDWWIANGVRSIPFTIATMPVGVVGGAGAGMLAKALGASKRAQMISSVVGGGLVGWDAERFLEAGGAFNDAINEGKTLQEASEIAAAVSKYNYATIPLNIAQMLPVFSKSFKFLNSALIEAGSGYFEEVTQGWAQAKAKAQAEGQDVSYLDYLTSPQAVQEGIIGAGMSQGFTLLSLNNTPNIDKQINALMTSIGTGGENQAALMLEVMKNNGSIDSKQYEEAKALLQYTMNAIEQTQNVNVEDSVKSALINKFVAIEKAKELLTDNENDLANQAAKELIEEKEKEIKNILKGTEPVYLVKIKGNDIPVVSTKEQVDAILSNPASLPLFEIEIYNDIKTQASLDEAYSKQEKDAIKTKDEVGSRDTSSRTDNTGAEVGDIASVTDKGESGKEVVAETEVVPALRDVESTAKAFDKLETSKSKEFSDLEDMFIDAGLTSGEYDNNTLSEAYHKAKKDGSNPELVKAVEELLSKEQTPTKEVKPSEVVSPAEIEAGRQEVSAVKKGKINTTKPIRLFKGLFGKRNPDGTRKSAHPNVKGVFSAVDEKIAERYRGEDGVGTFDIPAGTTIEVIKIENKKVPIPEFRKEETAAINASDAQVVKLITIDARGAEEQYIIKDPALIEKMQKPESQEVAKEQTPEAKEQAVATEKAGEKPTKEQKEENKEQEVSEAEVVKDPILKRLNKGFLKIGTTIFDNAKQLMAKAKELTEKGEQVQFSMTMPDGSVKTVKRVQAAVVDGFYSNTENALAQVKQEKMSGNQWATQLLSRGANKEEMGWVGLEGFLKENAAKSISKTDIQQYLKDNRIEVVEVIKGGVGNFYTRFGDLVPSEVESKLDYISNSNKSNLTIEQNRKGTWNIYDRTDSPLPILKEISSENEAKDIISNTEKYREAAPTKFSQYQLEGEKENYKEVLVTLPNVKEKLSNAKKEYDEYYNSLISKYGESGRLRYKISKSELDKLDELKSKVESSELLKKEGDGVSFKSTHFDEPNILVHLRMNTRTDADGKKVLFLEEVQSDWGQEGKRRGFADISKQESIINQAKEKINAYAESNEKLGLLPMSSSSEVENFKRGNTEATAQIDKEIARIERYKDTVRNNRDWDAANKEIEKLENEKIEIKKQILANFKGIEEQNKIIDSAEREITRSSGLTPTAPFVADTNAWTKLGLKVALKEAIKQGVDKIAWTTGEQQNDRYDLSKQVDEVNYYKTESGNYHITADKNGSSVSSGIYKENELEGILGKEIAKKIIDNEGETVDSYNSVFGYNDYGGNQKYKSLRGVQLSVGGKGMKGFYGSPTEGSLGIVGNVAKSLFKQEPKTVEIDTNYKGYNNLKIEDKSTDGEAAFVVLDGQDVVNVFDSLAEAKKYIDNLNKNNKNTSTQNSIDITPELKEQVEEGLPLFHYGAKGEILGFTFNGKIYLNGEKITAQTTMEEAGHIWVNWSKENAVDLYKAGLSKVKGSKYLAEVEANKSYQKEALKLGKKGSPAYNNYMKEEALAKAIADNGAKFVTETRKNDFIQWVNEMWKQVAKAFGIRDLSSKQIKALTLEEFAKMAAADVFAKEKQEFPENVLDIAKETGLSPQQVQNTYKKYDGSKNIEEITIEDYKNARATGDRTKLEVSAKAFDALLQQENAKTSTSPTAKKNAEKSLKEADEKAIKEASKIMEHINEIRAKIQESGIIESTSCKWGK
jgi:hypothetical protein